MKILPSSDENLILAAIRHKKQVPTINAEETPKRAPTPETGAGAGAGTGLDVQSTPQPPRLFKRPRIALSNAAAAAATTTTPTSVQSSVSSSSRPSA
ncbi:hypothetical protein BX616_002817 [Lobosporangium transversale]|nr:hypothetical protein BX616_002817 [Lobosporangium transversale]